MRVPGERFEALLLRRVLARAPGRGRNCDLKLRSLMNWAHADRLHALTEGLPALLVKACSGPKATAFLRMCCLHDPAAFDAVARDYIEKTCCRRRACSRLGGSAQSSYDLNRVARRCSGLLPTVPPLHAVQRKFHLDADSALQRALADALAGPGVDLCAGPGTHRAWDSCCRTWHRQILDETEPSLCGEPHRHHDTALDDEPVAGAPRHAVSTKLGPHRTAPLVAEQDVVPVESLERHEASRLAIEQPGQPARLLPGVAVEARPDVRQPTRCTSSARVQRTCGSPSAAALLLRKPEKVSRRPTPGLSEEIVEPRLKMIGSRRADHRGRHLRPCREEEAVVC